MSGSIKWAVAVVFVCHNEQLSSDNKTNFSSACYLSQATCVSSALLLTRNAGQCPT